MRPAGAVESGSVPPPGGQKNEHECHGAGDERRRQRRREDRNTPRAPAAHSPLGLFAGCVHERSKLSVCTRPPDAYGAVRGRPPCATRRRSCRAERSEAIDDCRVDVRRHPLRALCRGPHLASALCASRVVLVRVVVVAGNYDQRGRFVGDCRIRDALPAYGNGIKASPAPLSVVEPLALSGRYLYRRRETCRRT